ncbi:hypothetical protein [Propionivibrio sp.]|uniref:hypothetical protein n=1 Tax=Propionivibrio sp. TaxID=2212460 RepID=UPI003BF29E85
MSAILKTLFAFRFQGNRHERARRAASEPAFTTSPRNAPIELELRQGLDRQVAATLPGGFTQRRASGRGDARQIDRFSQMGESISRIASPSSTGWPRAMKAMIFN